MKSKSFYLTTAVIVIVSIISCARTNIELERSKIKYSKPQTATDLIEGEKVEYQLWFDKSKWKVVEHDNPVFKSAEEKAKEKFVNLSHMIAHNSNEIFIIIKEDRRSLTLESLYKASSKWVTSLGGHIISKDIRTVNNSDVLYIKFENLGEDSAKYIVLNYVYADKTGMVHVAAGTPENLFAEHESEMFRLLNGLVIPNSKIQPTKRDIESRLLKLKNLKDKGLITQEDYDKKKNELLDNY